ncbi:MAG: hypothetical protein CMG60_08100 [Candidatus Marinimicrobia bacterium]|nr:hypothetical protein [Candidatus Neomarinimicrobiota bacterium]
MDFFKEENVIIENMPPPPPRPPRVNTPITDGSPMEVDTDKKKTIVFCIPGETFSNEFLRSWTELFAYCMMNNITPIMSNASSNNWYSLKNKCLMGNVINGITQQPFQGKVDYDYIMWINNDMIFNVDMFKKLLSYNHYVVSGLYLSKDIQCYDVITKLDKDYLFKNGCYERLNRDNLNNWKNKQMNMGLPPVLDVDYCGMGFMLLKKGVLEKFQYPWFKPSLTTLQDGSGNILLQDYNNDEFYFCMRCKELGFNIYVDTEIVVGRQKNIIL